jgi:hypothetical protein
MGVNLDKTAQWKEDIATSVDMYNDWFLKFAPKTFRATRIITTQSVEATLKATDNLRNISPEILRQHPSVISALRMSTCPPLAVDRLIGLANVPESLVNRMEKEGKLPLRLAGEALDVELRKIGAIIERLADPDIFVWLANGTRPTEIQLYRAATIVADRLCGSMANPIIRNAQEERQLALIAAWLDSRGYQRLPSGSSVRFSGMSPGTYGFHMNVPINLTEREGVVKSVNVSVDVVIVPKNASAGGMPIFFEAKSAGDFKNVNKRRKEELTKVVQLRSTYSNVNYNLFLCGYFDGGYLGYEATENIDWVWEHRIDDLAQFGL